MRGLHTLQRTASSDTNDWCSWLNGGFPNGINGDADGEFGSPRRILIDLSQAMSLTLGKQMSQMSVYELDYIRIELLNVNNENDNDSGLSIEGSLYYWSPSKHRIDALQLARQVEKAAESTQIDDDSFLLSTERDYTGLRFNWDADNQVAFPTTESFGELNGTQWDMAELFEVYGLMQDSATEYANSLWTNRTGTASSLGFACSYVNATGEDLSDGSIIPEPSGTGQNSMYDPKSRAFELHHPLSVLGGLVMLDITHCSTDSPVNTIDDEYYVRVSVGVKGWSDF